MKRVALYVCATLSAVMAYPVNSVEVKEAFVYDPLGRVKQVKKDGQVITDYCYDRAGNRQFAKQRDGSTPGCKDGKYILPRPLVSNNGTHAGGGTNYSWSSVAGATCYKVKYADAHYQTINGTSFGTQPGFDASWIQACHEEDCNTQFSCLGEKTYL